MISNHTNFMRKIRTFMLLTVFTMVAMMGFAYTPADVGPPITENAALFKKDVSVTPAVMVINQQIDLEATDVGIPANSYAVIDKNYNAGLAKGSTGTINSTEVWRQPGNYDHYFNKEKTGYNSYSFIDRHRLSRGSNAS